MGLADAVRTRLALARGETLADALHIFFASKEERRKIAARKYPGRGVLTVGRGPRRPEGEIPEGLVDAAWYAQAQAVGGEEADRHFRERGLAAGLAPREALAGPDGRRLSGRGAEFLVRLGLPLGAVAGERGAEGLDPWTIGNPDGKALAVVTAVGAPGERLRPVAPEWAARADFFVVSDLRIDGCAPWRQVRPVFHHPDPARVVAFTKMHLPTFFGGYRRVLWLDPGVLCCADPGGLIEGPRVGCFRDEGRTPGAALAAAGVEAADMLGEVAGHPAFGQPDVLDPSVLLVDPSDADVARLMARWWRYAVRGPAEGGLALTLAAADVSGVALEELPGRVLERSPHFLRGPQ
jgi:hypothetical protein